MPQLYSSNIRSLPVDNEVSEFLSRRRENHRSFVTDRFMPACHLPAIGFAFRRGGRVGLARTGRVGHLRGMMEIHLWRNGLLESWSRGYQERDGEKPASYYSEHQIVLMACRKA